jgi:hypothetical protein
MYEMNRLRFVPTSSVLLFSYYRYKYVITEIPVKLITLQSNILFFIVLKTWKNISTKIVDFTRRSLYFILQIDYFSLH